MWRKLRLTIRRERRWDSELRRETRLNCDRWGSSGIRGSPYFLRTYRFRGQWEKGAPCELRCFIEKDFGDACNVVRDQAYVG